MVVYLNTQGARLVKEGRHLLVKKGEDTYHTLFTYKLRQIVVFGNVEITHRALAQIMRYEIDTVFLTQKRPLPRKDCFARISKRVFAQAAIRASGRQGLFRKDGAGHRRGENVQHDDTAPPHSTKPERGSCRPQSSGNPGFDAASGEGGQR